MSVFSNPASGAKESAAAYIEAVLELVDGKNPFEVLSKTSERIEDVLREVPIEKLKMPEYPGKWSIGEVVQHLADSELVWSYRLRSVIAEDRPIIAGYDQDKWAVQLGYADADPTASLEMFRLLREANMHLLGSLAEADFNRVGIHAERGEESIKSMIQLYAGHDLAHLRQIKRIRSKI